MRNIVLTGFMGTGKTAIGRIVARLLKYEFVDTDQLVEEVTGLTINQIFQKYGEVRFRSEEALVVKKLANKKRLVIATGGGVVLDEENVKILKKNGTFVLLTTDPNVILERVSRRNTRPLLAKGKTMDNILNLLKEREPYYKKCADLIVDTSSTSLDDTAEQVIKKIKEESLHE